MNRYGTTRGLVEPEIPFQPRGFPTLHLAGTVGALTVETADLVKTRIAIGTAAKLHGAVALIGEPGLGKTLSCGTAIRQLGLTSCYACIPPAPRGKELEETLLNSITSDDYDLSNTRATMRRGIRRVGLKHEFVFALDEIERAAGYGIELVRYEWDQEGNQVTFVIIGSRLDPFLHANPALRSRITRFVYFHPWSRGEACTYVRQYHPVFAGASDELLGYAFAEFAHGYFRNWARLLESLLTIRGTQKATTLTRAQVDEAIDLISQA